MKAVIAHKGKTYSADLTAPMPVSLPLRAGKENVNAWYLPPPVIAPVRDGNFTGRVAEGGSVNFNTITFNPHAHGTHTECLGHITREFYSVHALLKQFFFFAELISLEPEASGEDRIITEEQLRRLLVEKTPEALVIRTLPNGTEKCSRQYSHTHPPYLSEAAAVFIREKGVRHLLIDLPSVDKEKDEGKLLAHNAFWDMAGRPRTEATITEFIYVPDTITDGSYLLNLQVAPFENDAAPSNPVLYALTETS